MALARATPLTAALFRRKLTTPTIPMATVLALAAAALAVRATRLPMTAAVFVIMVVFVLALVMVVMVAVAGARKGVTQGEGGAQKAARQGARARVQQQAQRVERHLRGMGAQMHVSVGDQGRPGWSTDTVLSMRPEV